jgi:hypothetical protein
VETRARKIIADIMERAGTEERLRSPSVEEYFHQWLVFKKANKSANTSDRYKLVVDTSALANQGVALEVRMQLAGHKNVAVQRG